jgi:hypothetical protein
MTVPIRFPSVKAYTLGLLSAIPIASEITAMEETARTRMIQKRSFLPCTSLSMMRVSRPRRGRLLCFLPCQLRIHSSADSRRSKA